MKGASVLRLLVVVAVGPLAGCGDAGPQSGPGSFTATVVSPNGAEGSALVSFFGPGIGNVSSAEGRLFSERAGDTVRVVVAADAPGELHFVVAVADTTAPPQGDVLQVADGEDRLRSTVAGYVLEFRR